MRGTRRRRVRRDPPRRAGRPLLAVAHQDHHGPGLPPPRAAPLPPKAAGEAGPARLPRQHAPPGARGDQGPARRPGRQDPPGVAVQRAITLAAAVPRLPRLARRDGARRPRARPARRADQAGRRRRPPQGRRAGAPHDQRLQAARDGTAPPLGGHPPVAGGGGARPARRSRPLPVGRHHQERLRRVQLEPRHRPRLPGLVAGHAGAGPAGGAALRAPLRGPPGPGRIQIGRPRRPHRPRPGPGRAGGGGLQNRLGQLELAGTVGAGRRLCPRRRGDHRAAPRPRPLHRPRQGTVDGDVPGQADVGRGAGGDVPVGARPDRRATGPHVLELRDLRVHHALLRPGRQRRPVPAARSYRTTGGSTVTTDRTQLAKLVQPIPERFIKRDPDSGEAYVPHGVIKQFLLYILGPYDFEQVTILRSDVLKRKDKEFIEGNSPLLLTNVVVGATYRLSCEIDGRRTVVEETGEVEHPEQCPHDGARLKNAESDAIKRIANCIGLGLHLWAGELYVLHGWLPVPSRDGQTDKSGAERPARAAGTNGDAEPGSATSAPDPAPGTSGPAVPGKVTAGPDPTPATRKTSRRKTKATE